MAKNSTRRGLRLFQRAYSPVYHLLEATRNVGKSAFSRSGKIVDTVLGFGQDTGVAVTRGLNRSINGLVTGKGRKGRKGAKGRSTRRTRRASKTRSKKSNTKSRK
jgi:hypothetical protein